jgi:phosphate starvation-inducible protein PhoH
LSIAYGIWAVESGRARRFIIARPIVDVATGEVLTPERLGEMYYKIAAAYLEDILGPYADRSLRGEAVAGGEGHCDRRVVSEGEDLRREL